MSPGMQVVGSTLGYTNDYSGSCGGSSGPDHVYLLYLLNGPLNNVDITVAPAHADFQPVLYVRSTCATTETACNAAASVGGAATVHFDTLPSTVAVFVDGMNGTSGDFTLNATYSP
jgi:hypothetical protein